MTIEPSAATVASAGGETTIAQTAFGTVTTKRVVYKEKKGWFTSGTQIDVPLKHVTSVKLQTWRGMLFGLILIAVGGAALLSDDGGAKLFGVLLLGWALLLLWGSPSVTVNTAGQDLSVSRGLPWTKREAETFVNALRGQLFGE